MEVKRYCNKRKLKLLVIATVYDGIFLIFQTNAFPMLAIDHRTYQTDNYQKYSEAFYRQPTDYDDESQAHTICSALANMCVVLLH